MGNGHGEDDQPRAGPVLRLRLLWRRGTWHLVERIRLERKTLPPHQDLPDLPKGIAIQGFWFEAVDSDGKVAYRRFLQNPLRTSIELFDTTGEIRRADVGQEEVLFDALVPDRADLTSLRLYANPNPFVKAVRGRGRGRPLVSFELKAPAKEEAGDERQ